MTADADVAFGKPVIAGTRVPVALVFGELANEVPEEEIREESDLTHDQIQAALRYAAWLASQEVVRLRAERLVEAVGELGVDQVAGTIVIVEPTRSRIFAAPRDRS